MTRIVLLALLPLFVASAVHAGPGDYKEDPLRDQVKADVDFRCPQGTRRTVTDSKENLVETCVNSQGVRNGYFLKWAADGSTWLQIGSYADGQKDGKWIRFTKKGDAKKVTWFERGKATKKTRKKN